MCDIVHDNVPVTYFSLGQLIAISVATVCHDLDRFAQLWLLWEP